ncbi:uncharacterized protein LJ206_020623 isoform 1-T3 [Theristicus caerulescens]
MPENVAVSIRHKYWLKADAGTSWGSISKRCWGRGCYDDFPLTCNTHIPEDTPVGTAVFLGPNMKTKKFPTKKSTTTVSKVMQKPGSFPCQPGEGAPLKPETTNNGGCPGCCLWRST